MSNFFKRGLAVNVANLAFGVRADKSSLDSASVPHSGWCDQLLTFFFIQATPVGIEPTSSERQSDIITIIPRSHISFFCLYIYYNIIFYKSQFFILTFSRDTENRTQV